MSSQADNPSFTASDLDRIVNQFKEAWQRGSRPAIEEFLETASANQPEQRSSLLGELLAAELLLRREEGETIVPEDYRRRFPHSSDIVDRIFGNPPSTVRPASVPEYKVRCPHCQNPIQLADQRLEEVLCPACGSSFRLQDTRFTDTSSQMRQLGKFQLLERVGLGAFGAVWKARDTELHRTVALKIPHSSLLASPEGMERFYREARAAAQLRHPGIVTVHEVATLDDLPAIVADFVEGATLREFLQVRRPTFREAADMIARLADALDYAHTMGLVHRDIKPANIMLERTAVAADLQSADADPAGRIPNPSPDSTPKPLIMDFGLALRDEAEVTLTIEGDVVGTPAYMSPEQAAGRGHHVDRRSDIYSLGVVFYELLCGELPFRGSKQMILYQVLQEDPRPPRRVNDKIPRDLETICLKCLAKSPVKRYATARELADDLRRFLGGEPIQARPVRAWERVRKWVRRRPAVAGLIALVIAVATTGFAGILWQLSETEFARQTADTNAQSFKEASEQATKNANAYKAASELANINAKKANEAATNAATAAEAERVALLKEKKHLYIAHMNLAQRAWERADIPTVTDLLKRHIPKAGEDDNRGWEWYYFWGLLHSELYTLRGLPGPVRSIAFAPTKWSLNKPTPMLLAIACEDGSVFLWDAAAPRTSPKLLKKEETCVRCLAFSPDAKTLAWGTGFLMEPGAITIWNMDANKEGRVIKGHKYPINSLAFAPEGNLLAAAAVKLEPSSSGGPEAVHAMWTGRQNPCGELKLWNPQTGTELPTLPQSSDGVLSLDVDRKGQLLAGKASGATALWDLKKGAFLGESAAGYTQKWCVAIHPEAGRLAIAGSYLYRVNSKGLELQSPVLGDRGVIACAFSPDGEVIATAGYDRIIRLFSSSTEREIAAFRGHTEGIQAVAFSAHGRILATGSWDGMVKLWDLTRFQEWSFLEQRRAYTTNPAIEPFFSIDGKQLFAAGTNGGSGTKVWDWPSVSLRQEFTTSGGLTLTNSGKLVHSRWDGRRLSFFEGENGERPLVSVDIGPVEQLDTLRRLTRLQVAGS